MYVGKSMWTTFNPSFFHSFHLTAHLTRQLDLHARVQQDHHLYEKWRVYLVKRRAKNSTDSFSLRKKCFLLFSRLVSAGVWYTNQIRNVHIHLATSWILITSNWDVGQYTAYISKHTKQKNPSICSPNLSLSAITQFPLYDGPHTQPASSWDKPKLCPISWAMVEARPMGLSWWSWKRNAAECHKTPTQSFYLRLLKD